MYSTLCDGNFGALSVISRLNQEQINCLQNHNCTGSNIWLLYKDNFNENIDNFKSFLDTADINTSVVVRGVCIFFPHTIKRQRI
jgi:hypothetical protein